MSDTITAPVTPAPAPVTPAPAPAASPSVDLKSSPFSALDARARAVPAKVEPTKEPPKDGKVEAKVEPAKTGAPAAPKDDRTVRDPKWFREQHEKSQTELKTYTEKVKSLEAKIAEAEAKGKDVTVLSERLAKLEQERDQLRGELRAAKHEPSEEFQKQYVEPFNQAAAYAASIISQFTVTEEDGKVRAATSDDLDYLFKMPLNKASATARQMFGDDHQLVMNQITELHRLNHLWGRALEKEKATWKQRETEDQARRVQSDQSYKSMLAAVDKDLSETNPDFQDKPGDEGKEDRELRQEGYQLFDQKPDSIENAAIKSAYVRHIVGAHFPLIRQRDGLQAKVKELESTIAELRGNRPGPTGRPTPQSGGTTPEKSWEDELRESVPA